MNVGACGDSMRRFATCHARLRRDVQRRGIARIVRRGVQVNWIRRGVASSAPTTSGSSRVVMSRGLLAWLRRGRATTVPTTSLVIGRPAEGVVEVLLDRRDVRNVDLGLDEHSLCLLPEHMGSLDKSLVRRDDRRREFVSPSREVRRVRGRREVALVRAIDHALNEPIVAVFGVVEDGLEEHAAVAQSVEVGSALGEGGVHRGVHGHVVGMFLVKRKALESEF